MDRNPRCPLCNLSGTHLHLRLPQYTIFWCERCDTGFLELKSRRNFSGLYNKRYFNEQLSQIHRYYLGEPLPTAASRVGYQNLIGNFDRILDLIDRHSAGKKLLDIGSATGIFLHMARKRGYDVLGVEPAPYAARIANNKLNVRTLKTSIERVRIYETFDCISLLDVIEHLPDPRTVLKKTYSLLKKKGIIVIITPDYLGLIVRIAVNFYRFSNGKIISPLHRFYMPEHLYYFTKNSIQKLVQSAGFRIIKCMPFESAYQLVPMSYFTRISLEIIFKMARILKMQNRVLVIAQKI